MWAQVVSALLGVWLMAAPALLGYGQPASTNDRIVGPIVASLAIIAIWETTRPLRWVNIALGVWLLVAPWLLGYDDWIPIVNSSIVGLFLITLARLRGKIKHAYGGGWRSVWRLTEYWKGATPMQKQSHRARPAKTQSELSSPAEKQKRKERVLTQGMASITSSIADAVVIKDGNVFFLTTPQGEVPLKDNHGFGLYYHDCRYLNGYALRVAGTQPNALISDASQGFRAIFELTNNEIQVSESKYIRKDDIGITWERVLDGDQCALHDVISFQNYGSIAIEFPVSLAFQAAFEDIFAIRGLLPEQMGELDPPTWDGNKLRFTYRGADGLERRLIVHFSQPPDRIRGTTAHLNLQLQPREKRQLIISLDIHETRDSKQTAPQDTRPRGLEYVKNIQRRASNYWVNEGTTVESDSLLLNAIITRSLRDLHVLRTSIQEQRFFAAGVPWFATLFGRDSIITAIQSLAFNPDIAAGTLRLLARYQGERVDSWRDEQPGKILHELRIGELARLGEIPHTPYYGTIDATPLFLGLFAHHAAWTGDLTLFDELRGNVERGIDWMDRYGDTNGDGYVEYQSTSEKGLVNQGWKDSGDAIVNADGSLAQPPIALVEVQGYVYAAKRALADLYARAGETERAQQLRQQAQALRVQFNRDYWLDDLGFYALCLQRGGKPAAVVSSNPGQALWTGIVREDKARQTVERLMAADMFNGWGIRTLSKQENRYNPIGYHLGTVWPHDTSLIAAGFRRYGFDEAFQRVAAGIVQAAMHFKEFRLPELFGGFGRGDYNVPVRYPVACHPQAWAAGATLYLIETWLGLTPNAFERRLRVVRPLLPDFVDRLQVKQLRVGDARVDLGFERTRADGILCKVLKVDGALEVVVEPSGRGAEKQ